MSTANSHSCAGQRVLLVEDEQRLRGIVARYLRGRGHEVIEAATVEAACLELATQAVHTVLLDVNLAVGTGWDVMRWIEQRARQDASWERPRVVMLSAVPPSPKRLQEFKPDGVLNKPFPIDALGRLVESNCAPATTEEALE